MDTLASFDRPHLTRTFVEERFFGAPNELTSCGSTPYQLSLKLRPRPLDPPQHGDFEALVVGGHKFFMPTGHNSKSHNAVIELADHILDGDAFYRTVALAALKKIERLRWPMNIVSTFVNTLVPVTSVGGRKITSCSLPDFPLGVIFSDRALVHLPPAHISPDRSTWILAENLYHESVHQLVNYAVLCEDIFIDQYSSATSPKIPIEWRKNDSEQRNREWELDRVLHAASVYAALAGFRRSVLEQDDLSDVELHLFQTVAEKSHDNLDYLMAALFDNSYMFTDAGRDFVETLSEFTQAK